MGVYLSAPITEKVSVDKTCKNFVYGASSMQGWRMTQEDAHNCCPDFDPDRNGSLFAVYDGHGGAEVALYAALHLPDFIKSLKSYQDGDYRAALEEAFLRFDATLVDDKVIEELKGLAGEDPGEDEGAPEAVGKREADMLCAEANMPLDELLAKYEPASGTPLPLRDIRKKENILSPVVHNKHRFLEKGDCSADSPSGDGDSHIDFTRSSSLVTNLQGKLSNGHAENENNLNTEKEMQNNQNQNRNTQEAELSSSVTSEISEVKTAVEESPAADSSTSHTMKRSSKGPSVSSSSSTTKDFVSSSVEQQSSISEEPVCQSSGDIPSGNNSIQSDSCSQTSSCQENARVCGDSKVDDCSGPHSSSDCPSSSSDVPKSSSQDKADSSGNEVDAVSSRGDRDGPTDGGSDDRVGNEATGSEGDGVDSGKEASCSKKTLQETSGSGDGPCGSGSLDGPSSSVEGEEAGGSSSGAGGSGSQSGAGVTDRPDLITGDDSDDDDDDDDEYQEDSEEDFEDDDDDDEEEEEEEGEIDGTGFQQCVDMSNEEPGSDSGCTACLALFLGKDLWVANAGDSRCVLSRAGKAVDLSFDHKPEDDIERKRIEKAGGKVTSDGRVNGGLNLSRALGDHYYKRNEELPAQEQMITALPDIEHVTIGDDDEFVVIACDGIWNYMSSEDVISMVGQELKDPEKRKKPSLICEKMFDHCLAPNTFGDGTGCDNMTCIIIVLKPQSISSSSEASKRCAGEMDSCSSTEDGLAEKRTKLDSSTSGVDDTV